MNELELELNNLQDSIRTAVVAGDEFEYHKLLRAKDETESRLFFRRQKEIKDEIQLLRDEKNTTKAVIDDLTKHLVIQADKVRELRSRAYDEQEIYNQLSFKVHLLRTKEENNKEAIWELQQKLHLATDKKLNPGKFDEFGELKKPQTDEERRWIKENG